MKCLGKFGNTYIHRTYKWLLVGVSDWFYEWFVDTNGVFETLTLIHCETTHKKPKVNTTIVEILKRIGGYYL